MKSHKIVITWTEADSGMPACYSVVLYKDGHDDHIGDAYPDDLGGNAGDECESAIIALCHEHDVEYDDVEVIYDL